MPRVVVEDNRRLSLRIRARDKAVLMRAVALENTDLTDFVIQSALEAAKKTVIEQAERVPLSERDSLRVLAALEQPPAPNARLLRAAKALTKYFLKRVGLNQEIYGMKNGRKV